MPFKSKRQRQRVMGYELGKRTTNAQYRKSLKKLAPFADADGDRVRNIDDCRPFDKKRQDAQVFLAPTEEDIPTIKKFNPELTDFSPNTILDAIKMQTDNAVAFHIKGIKDKTFIGNLKDLHLGEEDIKTLAKTLQHEEVHNILGEKPHMFGLTKKEGLKASSDFDKISIPLLFADISRQKVGNPKSHGEISPAKVRTIEKALKNRISWEDVIAMAEKE